MITPKRSSYPSAAAFTLIELLTVIAIIGILAAILLPVVGKVRDNARASVCLSNMRQVSLAMLMFADDNDGVLPTSGDTASGERETDWIYWRDSSRDRQVQHSPIAAYMGGSFSPDIYRCPSDENIRSGNTNGYPYSFSMNREIGEDRRLDGRIHNVENPTRIILLVEEAHPNDSSAWLIDRELDVLTERHGRKGHVSFLDAHVARVTRNFASHRQHWDPFYRGRPYSPN